ncbi:MAG TPA: hypothetical protein PLX85_04595 [Dehalococcoidia bacterium]|nr:hypothetical protein [Dehalococcoidia bacterium]
MPSEAYREARATAKQARATAKEARKRWLHLRPWYFKKRFILGIPILLAMAAVVAVITISIERESSPATEVSGHSADVSATGSATAASNASEPGRLGALVRIGSIDLTVLAFEPIDSRTFSPANDANYRIRFHITNARGPASENYRLVDAAFQLIDGAGSAHDDWRAVCQNCPDALGSGVSLTLNGSVDGAVYFRIPAGQTPVELRYQSPNSTNSGRIALR